MNVIENDEQYKRTKDWYDKFAACATTALDLLVKESKLDQTDMPLRLKLQVTSCFSQMENLAVQMTAYEVLVLKKKPDEL